MNLTTSGFPISAISRADTKPSSLKSKAFQSIARGLLSEDDYLLTEILFNPKTPAQIDNIVATLTRLSKIIDKKDSGEMKRFLDGVRKNLE